MARKPLPPAEVHPDPVAHEALAAADANALQVSIGEEMSMGSLKLGIQLGRMQAAGFYETVSSKLMIQSYLEAKATIGEMGSVLVSLPSGEAKRVSSIDEFCELAMPVKARRLQQLVANRQLVGDELYEQAEKLGFGQRDYQALKALPIEDQEIVKQAIATDDREHVINLLAELAARNRALREQAQELQEINDAKDKVIEKRNTQLTKLETWRPDPDSVARNLAEDTALHQIETQVLAIDNDIRMFDTVVRAIYSNDPTPAIKGRCKQALEYVVLRFADMVELLGIEVDLTKVNPQRPDWVNAKARAVLDAATANADTPAPAGKRGGKAAANDVDTQP
jgi:hypothetical protein